jgi:hypothetical protein
MTCRILHALCVYLFLSCFVTRDHDEVTDGITFAQGMKCFIHLPYLRADVLASR